MLLLLLLQTHVTFQTFHTRHFRHTKRVPAKKPDHQSVCDDREADGDIVGGDRKGKMFFLFFFLQEGGRQTKFYCSMAVQMCVCVNGRISTPFESLDPKKIEREIEIHIVLKKEEHREDCCYCAIVIIYL